MVGGSCAAADAVLYSQPFRPLFNHQNFNHHLTSKEKHQSAKRMLEETRWASNLRRRFVWKYREMTCVRTSRKKYCFRTCWSAQCASHPFWFLDPWNIKDSVSFLSRIKGFIAQNFEDRGPHKCGWANSSRVKEQEIFFPQQFQGSRIKPRIEVFPCKDQGILTSQPFP